MMSFEIILLIFGLCIMAVLSLVLLVMLDRQRNARLLRINRAAAGFVQSSAKDDAAIDTELEQDELKGATAVARIMAKLESARTSAGFKFSVHELLAQLSIGVMVTYLACLLLLKVSPILAAVLALVVPVVVMILVFKSKRKRHIANFTGGLPEALDVFARGLKAGRPVADSLSIVVENATGPVKSEFERCRDELQVGASLISSLERLCTRMPTQEVIFFSVATSLQSETGGNLIETIENLADQLRERRKLKKKARALSSEARASAMILASLPFAVCTVLAVLNPNYLEPLMYDSRGQIMLTFGLSSVVFGVYIMARMGKLDV